MSRSCGDDKVNHRLLDCSDAHFFSDSGQAMRLGACMTWMNTIPTFAGLSYALEEFDRRVYVGLEPPALARIRKNPERFISTVEVKSDSDEHNLFDYTLPLSPGFVAVVGNKGQGKSALLDCIALAGNSSRNKEFAFLTPARFLSPTSKKHAREYYSELAWATGVRRQAQLPDDHDRSAPVYVEYLPQAFVERVCNADPVTGDADEFERELRVVLFTHIREQERSGATSFDALLTQKTRTSQGDIDRLRDELHAVINSYVAIASFRAGNQLSEVDGRLSLKQAEVSAAEEARNAAETALTEIDSSRSDSGQLTALTQRSEEIEAVRVDLVRRQAENEQRQAQARRALSDMEAVASRAEALRAQVVELNAEADALLSDEGDAYVSLTINRSRYDTWRDGINEGLATARAEHDEIVREIAVRDEERRSNADELAAADSTRERARQRVLQSDERVAALVGNENDEESLTGLRALRERITNAPNRMDELRTQIVDQAGRIHAALNAQLQAASIPVHR
jgi:hypothetical protein